MSLLFLLPLFCPSLFFLFFVLSVYVLSASVSIKYIWPQLLKSWIALSTGEITIQWIRVRETNCIIHWIEIYPVDSAIQLLNNWGLIEKRCRMKQGKPSTKEQNEILYVCITGMLSSV